MTENQLLQLLDDMTLDEKIDQLCQLHGGFYGNHMALTGPEQAFDIHDSRQYKVGSILGECGFEHLKKIQDGFIAHQPPHIPAIFMADVIHGFRTVFPVPIAQGASFNPELTEKISEAAAKECSAAGLHATFAPMADLCRDSRWGRVMEGTGEDVYLNSRFAESAVKGFQGDNCGEKGRIASCVKHFAGYGGATAGRDYNALEVGERSLAEDYLPSYHAAINAGAELVMTSFNTIDRLPATLSRKLNRDILRDKFGFEGVLITDYNAIGETLVHGASSDKADAAQKAMNAGVDIDMMSDAYLNHLKSEVEAGRVSEATIDEACMRVLRPKNKLGLFENPYKDGSLEAEKKYIYCKEFLNLSRRAAEETTILLKNNGILPLDTSKKIVVVGALAESRDITGSWAIFAQPEHTVTLRRAFEELYPKADISFYATDEASGELISACASANAVILCLGEDQSRTGEGKSVADTSLSASHKRLFETVANVNQNTVALLFGGRPLCVPELDKCCAAVVEAWLPGTCGTYAVADIIFGRVNPSARVPMSFPYCPGQLPMCYCELPTGRPKPNEDRYYPFVSNYMDVPNKPLYSFGHGLSYTKFEYSKVELSGYILERGKTITASVTVTNTGDMDGAEPVQLYIRDLAGSVSRPVKQLKGVKKLTIKSGESARVSFEIDEDMLKFYDIDMNFTAEPGKFQLWIGGSSETDNCAYFELR